MVLMESGGASSALLTSTSNITIAENVENLTATRKMLRKSLSIFNSNDVSDSVSVITFG